MRLRLTQGIFTQFASNIVSMAEIRIAIDKESCQALFIPTDFHPFEGF
jgi:hypothetical protein